MGICQNIRKKKNDQVIKANENIKNLSNNNIKTENRNKNLLITHNNDVQLSNINTGSTDASPQSKILFSPQQKNGQAASTLSSNSTTTRIGSPHSSSFFNIEATIGETEIPIFVEKNENIIIKLNDNNINSTWSFLKKENPIYFLGYPNYKYKDNNIGALFLRISGSSQIYHLNKNINIIKANSKGSLLFFANLDPNDYSIYEPKGSIMITIIGGNHIFENELNSLYDMNNIITNKKKNNFNYKYDFKEKLILKYINKARNDMNEFFNEYFNINDSEEVYKELKDFIIKNNFKRKELIFNKELNDFAKEHCEYLCNNGTNGETDKYGVNIKEKIKKKSRNFFIGVNTIYEINNPLLIVKRMIHDKYSKNKINRSNIFFHQFNKVGICLREHISYKYCCIIIFSE